MVLNAKLYHIFLSFWFLPLFLLRGLTWAVLQACPGHHPKPIAQNRGFKIESPEPLLKGAEGLHENFAEINFLVVSDRRDQYLSDAFGPITAT